MSKSSPASMERFSRDATHWAAMLGAILLGAAILAAYELPVYRGVAGWSAADESLIAVVSAYTLLLGKSLWLLSPFLLLSAMFHLQGRILAGWLAAAGSAAALAAWAVCDTWVLQMTSQHLHWWLEYAHDANALEMMGGGTNLIRTGAGFALLGGSIAAVVLIGAAVLRTWYFRYRAAEGEVRFVVIPTTAYAACMLLPTVFLEISPPSIPVVRMIASLPISMPFVHSTANSRWESPDFIFQLNSRLANVAPSYLQQLREVPAVAAVNVDSVVDTAPNVIVLVLESLRHDSFDPRWMPRVAEWSQRGLVLEHHYAGSNCSHVGLFSLLYGRHAITYNTTLDAHVPSQLIHSLRSRGYQSTAHLGFEARWQRMEEYLSPLNFDTVIEDPSPTWPQRDRNALQKIGRELSRHDTSPQFMLAFLMSSHFPYPYPSQHARFSPVAEIDSFSYEQLAYETLAEENPADDRLRQEWLNRYRNSLGFLDDALGDLLDSIDLERNIVVITGDHGEAFGEDGKWLHSSRLSTWQTRVPMIVLGAGVPAGTIETPTMHMDIATTILHAATGVPSPLPHSAGHDLLEVAPGPRDVLLVNVDGQHMVLITESGRLHLLLDAPRTSLTSLGFHDENGAFRSLAGWDPGSADDWLAKIEAKLSELNP